MKHWALVAGLLGLTSVTVAQDALPEPRWGDPCARFTPDATYVTSTIIMQLEKREVQLRVPVDYFEDAWDRVDGFADTAQLFSVEMGTFDPISRPEDAARRKRGEKRRPMTFIVSDVVPFDRLGPIWAEQFMKSGDFRHPLSLYPRHPGPFGLSRIFAWGQEQSYDFQEDLLIAERPDVGVTAVIACDKPGSVKRPGCDHSFSTNGLDVGLDYDLEDLRNWERLQSDVSKFLACAINFTK
ncbi:MAG: hypothetical protein V4516_06130 [Pseudomonadota bacterium]